MNLAEQLAEAVLKERKRIVVIGDAMRDHWVHGHTEDCQDDCQRFVTKDHCGTMGGAANAHRCLKHWAVNTDMYSYPESVWPIKTRFVTADGKIAMRWDNELELTTVPPGWGWGYNVDRALEMTAFADAVLLSDYDKGFLTPKLIGQVVEICKRRDVPCVADTKRSPEVYAGCVLKCNEWYAGRFLRSWASQHIVVTRGADGPYHMGETLPGGPLVQCVNHVGAGDCFAAHLALALAYGFSLKDAAAIAHSAGRVYVQHEHNRSPCPSEIAADMASVC